jgi:hypothetical protein
MKYFKCLLGFMAIIALSGCAGVTHVSGQGQGLLFTSVKGPITVGPSSSSSKSGQACAVNILGLISTGDKSISTAASNAGISDIQAVDYDTNNILGLFTKSCTVVQGE